MNIPETFFTAHQQLVLFGLSCLFGVLLGVFYDIFRTVRIIFPHNTWLVIIEDVIYLSVYTVFLNAFTSAAARGEFRIYYIIGNILGFTIYFFTIGSIVIKIMRKLFVLIQCTFKFIMSPVKRLYAFIYKKVHKKIVRNSKCLVKFVKNLKNLLLKLPKMLYNNKESKNRKNVKNVVKKSKTSKEKKETV